MTHDLDPLQCSHVRTFFARSSHQASESPIASITGFLHIPQRFTISSSAPSSSLWTLPQSRRRSSLTNCPMQFLPRQSRASRFSGHTQLPSKVTTLMESVWSARCLSHSLILSDLYRPSTSMIRRVRRGRGLGSRNRVECALNWWMKRKSFSA